MENFSHLLERSWGFQNFLLTFMLMEMVKAFFEIFMIFFSQPQISTVSAKIGMGV